LNNQANGGPLPWKAVKTKGYFTSGGAVALFVAGLTLVASTIGLIGIYEAGSWPSSVMFLVPFSFAVFFLFVTRASYRGKRVMHSSIGIIACTGVTNVKRYIKGSLSAEDVAFEVLGRRPNPFAIDFGLNEDSGSYSIDGGRFFILAVDLNAPRTKVKTTSAIIMGPVGGQGSRYVSRFSKGIEQALAREGIWSIPLDGRLEDYRIPPFSEPVYPPVY
jgi:hypothetical protein